MRMTSMIRLAALAVSAATLCSCTTPSGGVVVESYPQNVIHVNSAVVGRRVEIVEINYPADAMPHQAQIRVQNKTRKDVPFEYRFRWQDEKGMAQEISEPIWIPVSLSGRESQLLRGIAPNQQSKEFIFEIRFSRPSTRWGA